ncbi:hypothetical protein Pfo_015129 [Paulownia fortunei]|nr:hypothetical protein Pfo_015129 [Paulownia fortunei]
MASEKLGMVPAQPIHNGLNPHPQLVFPEAFPCGPLPPHRRSSTGDPDSKAATRELTASFLDHHHYFQPQPAEFRHQWNANSLGSGGDASEDDDGEDDDDEEEEEEENNLVNIVAVAKIGDSNQNESYSANSNSQKMKHISALGIKEGNAGQSGNESNNENNSSGEVGNARGGEMYYTQYLNSAEGPSSSSGRKDIVVEHGCGFSGRKEDSYLSESGESLGPILSDPLTGILMDDAVILPCGHSFGSGGIQQIIRMKACCTCSHPVSEDSIAPNLSLRLAVQAFRREEELQVNRTLKRRRERYDRDKGTYGDSILTDHPRGRGVQFPFIVTDRVIIKGNKRTPQRFVGREAIVTTQCLNGWYVVKTLDNAESVKLQYRSLAKVTENPSAKPSPFKMTPNWL